MRSSWTHEMMEALSAALDRGLSAGEAARELTHKFGRHITRNAVIGKASRTGLTLARSKPNVDHAAAAKRKRENQAARIAARLWRLEQKAKEQRWKRSW